MKVGERTISVSKAKNKNYHYDHLHLVYTGTAVLCIPGAGDDSGTFSEVGVSFVQMLVTVPTFLSIVVAIVSDGLL